MVLVTGQMRSGTTFMMDAFSDWGMLLPSPIYTQASARPDKPFRKGRPFSLNEVHGIGFDCRDDSVFSKVFSDISAHWEVFGEVMIKCHQAALFPSSIVGRFSSVIVCTREPSSWVRSALAYKDTHDQVVNGGFDFIPGVGEAVGDEKFLLVGSYLYLNALRCIEFLRSAGVTVFEFRFHEPSSLVSIVDHYGFPDFCRDYVINSFRGSSL